MSTRLLISVAPLFLFALVGCDGPAQTNSTTPGLTDVKRAWRTDPIEVKGRFKIALEGKPFTLNDWWNTHPPSGDYSVILHGKNYLWAISYNALYDKLDIYVDFPPPHGFLYARLHLSVKNGLEKEQKWTDNPTDRALLGDARELGQLLKYAVMK